MKDIKTIRRTVATMANQLNKLGYPYDSYEQMEYDFLIGMEFSSPQNRLIMPNEINQYKNRLDSARKSGYVILLRSKGENYLRENIGDRTAE